MERTHHKEAVVQLTSVSFQYEDKVVLDDVTFTLERGDFVGIVGPNGSGKSTLMKLILGLLPATKGKVELFGQPLSRFRDWTWSGFVPLYAQPPEAQPSPFMLPGFTGR